MVSTSIDRDDFSLGDTGQIESPSYFPNPQTRPQGDLLLEVLMRFDTSTTGGIVVDIGDWDTVGDSIGHVQTGFEDYDGGGPVELSSYPLIINPDFSAVMGYGQQRDVERISEMPFLPNEAEEIASQLLEDETDQIDVRQDAVYPMIQSTGVIRDTMRFQADQGASVVAPPTIPLRTKGDFENRIEVVKSILDTGSALYEGGLFPASCELLNIISLKPSVFDMPEGSDSEMKRWDRLVEVASNNSPDIFGIHIQEIDFDDVTQNQNLLDSIERINEKLEVPTILFNTREFGIPALLYGVNIISGPIATDPYPFYGSQDTPPPTRLGSYYHPVKMDDLSREELRETIRDENYRLPCHCELCQDIEFFTDVSDDDWNDFRRVHYLLTKDSEIRQVRETDKIESEAIRDKIANSQRGHLLPYLPT